MRDRMQRDFGADVQVGEGAGTEASPFELLDREPAAALRAALRAVQILNDRIFRVLWKFHRVEHIEHQGAPLLRVEFASEEPNSASGRWLVREYFFRAPGARIDLEATANQLGRRHGDGRISIPFELGALHLVSDGNYTSEDEGPGRVFHYRAFGASAPLFLYGARDPGDIGPEQLDEEYARALAFGQRAHPESRRLGFNPAWFASGVPPVLAERFQRSATEFTCVLLGSIGGAFARFEISANDDPRGREASISGARAFQLLVAPASTTATGRPN
jgi:hypothetical protein